MEAPLMAGLESQGIASHGPMPAGMLRIRHGSQERYVWPVHLGGWLAMGWRVAGGEAPSIGVAAAEPPASPTVLDPVPATESPSEPAPTRGRRGRRRKEEQEQPPAAIEATPEPTRTTAEVEAADSEPPLAADLAAESITNPGNDSTADGELSLTALPDDLFDDPLI